MSTVKHPLRIQVGPFTLVSVSAGTNKYHSNRWALPGGGVTSTIALQGIASVNGWSKPYIVDRGPLSLAQVS